MRSSKTPLCAISGLMHCSKKALLLDHLVGARQVHSVALKRPQLATRRHLTSRGYSSCLQRVTYCESSGVQKMQRCAGVKVNSRAKNLGSSDWNSSRALSYAAQEGVLGPFGSPVLANWVQ